MPLPKPKPNEERNEWISRCMSLPQMKEEFPDTDQRLAVCFSQWRAVHGGKPPQKYALSWEGMKKFVDLTERLEKLTAEVGDEYIRVRVKSPDDFDSRSFRIIDIDRKRKIRAVVGCPKGQFKGGRCQVGTEVQAFLFHVDNWTEAQALAWVREHQ